MLAAEEACRSLHLRILNVVAEDQDGGQSLSSEGDKRVRRLREHKPLAITENEVELDDGSRLDHDFVIQGVGVKPRTELAEAAGAEIVGQSNEELAFIWIPQLFARVPAGGRRLVLDRSNGVADHDTIVRRGTGPR